MTPMWPNQTEVVDGIVPADEVPQDYNLIEENDGDFDVEMGE